MIPALDVDLHTMVLVMCMETKRTSWLEHKRSGWQKSCTITGEGLLKEVHKTSQFNDPPVPRGVERWYGKNDNWTML